MPRDRLAEALIERERERRGARSTWDSLWQAVTRYLIPEAATFQEEVSPGVERNRHVLDSTGPRSLELFASFLHTLLNNPAAQWFKLREMAEVERDYNSPVRTWAETAERQMLAEMARAGGGFYQQLHSAYLDIGAVGTAVLSVEAPGGRLRVRHHHLKDCVIDENDDGQVDSIYRQREWTPRQAHQRFPGLELPKDQTHRSRFLHCVFPTDDRDFAPLLPEDLEAHPWASVWVHVEQAQVLDRGGYDEFPYMVPRWLKWGSEMYGRSPGMTALPDLRMVNRMMETVLRGAEKLVDPPLVWRDGALLSPVRAFPGGMTFTDADIEPRPLIPPGASRIEVGNALLEMRQAAIREAFFVPLFASHDNQYKTATAVMQETDERNRAVSPMLMRMQEELFHPLIRRVFAILSRNGLIEDPPVEAAVDVEYVSPLVASQRQLDGLAIARLFEGLAPWSQTDEGVFDVFDTDEIAKAMHAASGAPAHLLRSPQEVKKLRQARQRQEQQQEATQTGFAGAEAAAKLMAAQK